MFFKLKTIRHATRRKLRPITCRLSSMGVMVSEVFLSCNRWICSSWKSLQTALWEAGRRLRVTDTMIKAKVMVATRTNGMMHECTVVDEDVISITVHYDDFNSAFDERISWYSGRIVLPGAQLESSNMFFQRIRARYLRQSAGLKCTTKAPGFICCFEI